jgi:hypothetical protein
VILLYAIVPAGQDVGALPNANVTLTAEPQGRVAAVYEECDSAPSRTAEALAGYAAVLMDLTGRSAILPARFGTVVDSATQLRDLLRDREHEWAHRLTAVAGHVEMIVHVPDPAPDAARRAPASGREYLLARVAAERRRERLQRELLSVVEGHCRETRWLRGINELRLACLVPAEAEDWLRREIDAWGQARPQSGVTVTGPFPVLSFTEGDDDPSSGP